MCTWGQLIDGTLTVKDLMEMHRNLNLKEWIDEQIVLRAKQEVGKA